MSWLADFVVSHILSIVSFVLAIVLVARAESQRRPTGSTVAWLLAVLFNPYVGIPLYLFLGGRKLKQRAAAKDKLHRPTHPSPPSPAAVESHGPIARMLCASGAGAPTAGNHVALLPTGELSYAAVVEAIESAERTIDISTLIFANDEVGDAIAQKLVAKAQQGVQVRLLIDALFEYLSSHKQMGLLHAGGVHVAWFMPLGSITRRGSANLRLHRKAILVDDRLAIVGGMNIATEYMGETPSPKRWRDLSARVTGPCVSDIASIFRADWAFAAGEKLVEPPPEAARPAPASPVPTSDGDVTIQVVGSGPDVESDLIYDAVLSSVFTAKRRLWIATPYFVPDEALVRGLALAVRRGVDVCIVVPKVSNHLTADLAGASYLRDLDRIGARIRCYAPGMMHAKLVIVDDDLGILGSANMDMRSFFLDYEIALFIESVAEIQAMARWLEELLPTSVDLTTPGPIRRWIESAARLLAPLE